MRASEQRRREQNNNKTIGIKQHAFVDERARRFCCRPKSVPKVLLGRLWSLPVSSNLESKSRFQVAKKERRTVLGKRYGDDDDDEKKKLDKM